MNGSVVKKLRKYVRRMKRGELELIQGMMRPKPKWMPIWLWKVGIRLYFKTK